MVQEKEVYNNKTNKQLMHIADTVCKHSVVSKSLHKQMKLEHNTRMPHYQTS